MKLINVTQQEAELAEVIDVLAMVVAMVVRYTIPGFAGVHLTQIPVIILNRSSVAMLKIARVRPRFALPTRAFLMMYMMYHLRDGYTKILYSLSRIKQSLCFCLNLCRLMCRCKNNKCLLRALG